MDEIAQLDSLKVVSTTVVVIVGNDVRFIDVALLSDVHLEAVQCCKYFLIPKFSLLDHRDVPVVISTPLVLLYFREM